MSYRTRINDCEIFGNNECYPEWIDFIKSQGIDIKPGNIYEGTIKDFMGALVIIEKITLRLTKERHERINELKNKGYDQSHLPKELFDWSNATQHIDPETLNNNTYGTSLFDKLTEIIDESYAFYPYQFYKACEDKLEQIHCFTTDNHFYCYKIKEGETLTISAF